MSTTPGKQQSRREPPSPTPHSCSLHTASQPPSRRPRLGPGASSPGFLLRLFLEPKSLTREKTLSFFLSAQLVLDLLGLLTHLQALDFSRSLACLFWRIRELAMAAAIAATLEGHSAGLRGLPAGEAPSMLLSPPLGI